MVIGCYTDNDIAAGAGSASVYKYELVDDVMEVTFVQELFSPEAAASDRFGASVDIQEDLIIVGGENLVTDEIDGAGGICLFQKNEDGTWGEGNLIHASDAAEDARFGYSVSIDGEYIAVGSRDAYNPAGDKTGASYILEYCAFPPNITASASATVLCEGNETTLTVEGVESYTWTPEVEEGPFTPPIGTTTYTVLGTDEVGCQNEASIDITVHENTLAVEADITYTIEGEDGAIDLTVSGDHPDYVFDWNTDEFGDYDDEEDLIDLSDGIYTVIIRDAVGCELLESFLIDSQLGIDELSEVVKVYPNPATSNLTIELEGVYTYAIYNLSGALVQQGQGNDIETVDVSELTSGAYVLQIVSNNETIQLNLVKQ